MSGPVPAASRELREGFTTGSAATAAAVGALSLLLGEDVPSAVVIPVPPDAVLDKRLRIPLDAVRRHGSDLASCAVIKDGGDDPDATRHARIEAEVRFSSLPVEQGVNLRVLGGRGVGRVTLPGLPVAVGQAAINPGPRSQIERAVRELCAARGTGGAVTVVIHAPDGEALARRTLNARLGIVGGISILGTQGTVRPYSHRAWQQAIIQSLDVARASGLRQAALSSGRRSERLLMRVCPWPELAFIQAADFIGFTVREAAARGFASLVWGGFFGKLLKLAQGHLFTHARSSGADFEALADLCAATGINSGLVKLVRSCNTAAQALDTILPDPKAETVLRRIAGQARSVALTCAQGRDGMGLMDLGIHLFHMDGRELVRCNA